MTDNIPATVHIDLDAVAAFAGIPKEHEYYYETPAEDDQLDEIDQGIQWVRRSCDGLLIRVSDSHGDCSCLTSGEGEVLAKRILEAVEDCKTFRKKMLEWVRLERAKKDSPAVTLEGQEIGRTYQFGAYLVSMSIVREDFKTPYRFTTITNTEKTTEPAFPSRSSDLTISLDTARSELKVFLSKKESEKHE